MLVPVAMLLVLLVVQVCLWAHAAQVVQSAAAQGVQAAADLGGTPSDAERSASSFLAADTSVVDPKVTVSTMPEGEVQVQVSAATVSILPFLHLEVAAARRGSLQEFRGGE